MAKNPLILGLQGSPRKNSNTDALLESALEGARKAGAKTEKLHVSELNINPCTGCLRCNVLGRCSIDSDGWPEFREKWIAADGVIIASPVYFHSITGQLKCVIDRFRSFLHVTMRSDHLEYKPIPYRPKNGAVILVQGEPMSDDYTGALELLKFFIEKIGGGEFIGNLIGTSLGVRSQISMQHEKLSGFGDKMGWPDGHAEKLVCFYRTLKTTAHDLGRRLAKSIMETQS